jgi:hypothetical protein
MFTKETLDNMRDLVRSLSSGCGAARDEAGSEDDHGPIGEAMRSRFPDVHWQMVKEARQVEWLAIRLFPKIRKTAKAVRSDHRAVFLQLRRMTG